MSILGVDCDNINLHDYNNFDEDGPDAIVYVRLVARWSKFEKCEAINACSMASKSEDSI